jgi:hypothetical protein
VQPLCQKAGKIFRRIFGGFRLDCLDAFSLMRKSCSNFSAVGKDREGTEKRSASALKNRLAPVSD